MQYSLASPTMAAFCWSTIWKRLTGLCQAARQATCRFSFVQPILLLVYLNLSSFTHFIGVYRKFNASRGKNKINSFIFYCEAQLKLSKFNTRREENKANSFVFLFFASLNSMSEAYFKLSNLAQPDPQFHPKRRAYSIYSRQNMTRINCFFASLRYLCTKLSSYEDNIYMAAVWLGGVQVG